MYLLQQSTPDTSPYMIAGYVVIFAVMLIYVLSLVVRRRSLVQDLETLHELEEQDS